MPTFAEYLDGWLKKSASRSLTNPLVKMRVERFRKLTPEEFRLLQQHRALVLGTASDPVPRNLHKNFENYRRERGEHTAFIAHGSIAMKIAGSAWGKPEERKDALLPILLRRVKLVKVNDQIKADPDEEELWDINSVLPMFLRDSNITLPRLNQESIFSVVSWLRSQLGNRGQVDEASYIGLFSSQQKVIRERLMEGSLRRSLAANEVIKARIDERQTADTVLAGVCDEGIEDLGIVLPVDDSQLRVIQLAEQGHCLHVEGPPGTGKSQTIANIITSALWRGRNVLLVCDKKPAIQQVEERLTDAGLGPALLNLHQEDLTSRDLIRQASQAFGQTQTRTPFPVEELENVRKALNERVRSNQQTCHPAAQVKRFEALDGLLRLKRELPATPQIKIANWQTLSPEGLRQKLNVIEQWLPLKPIVSNSANIWNSLKHESYEANPNANNEIFGTCGQIAKQIESLHDTREVAGSLGCAATLGSDADIGGLIALARAVIARPVCYARVLNDPEITATEFDALQSVWNERSSLETVRHPIDLTSTSDETVKVEAEKLLKEEQSRTWNDLLLRRDFHTAQIEVIEELERRFQNLRQRLGLIDSPLRSRRESALRLIQSLAAYNVLIPKDWWSLQTTPLASIHAWKIQFSACVNRVNGTTEPADLSAFTRLKEPHLKALNTSAEKGFNVVNYVLHPIGDAKSKFALRQVFPRLQIKKFKGWHDLTLHALDLQRMVEKIEEKAAAHPFLAQQSERLFTSSVERGMSDAEVFASYEFASFVAVAELVEQIRQKNNLFELESPIWQSFWLSAQTQLLEEVGEYLAGLTQIHPGDDDLTKALAHHRGAHERIERFCATVPWTDGDLQHPIMSSFVAQARWHQLSNQLEPLRKYVALQADDAAEPAWQYLSEAIRWRDGFKKQAGEQNLNIESRYWSGLLHKCEAHVAAMTGFYATLESYFDEFRRRFTNYAGLKCALDELLMELQSHSTLWLQKAEWQNRVRAHPEVADLWRRVQLNEISVEQAAPLFCFNLLFNAKPFAEPHGSDLSQKLTLFQSLEEQLSDFTASKLQKDLKLKMQQARIEFAANAAEIGRLAGLQRIQGKPREVLNRHRAFLLAHKRCWMMSPTSLANLIDDSAFEHGPPFDLVIFDEASQIRVLDGLLSMAFGKQVIIVGDRKQLPPTEFFSGLSTSDGNEEDFGTAQSLLEEFSGTAELPATLPCAMLMSHYRSETPDLIRFSNNHFYDRQLEVYPPARVTGIGRRLHYVADGIYGAGASRWNEREADEVVKLVEVHVREYPTLSLGVVAMNMQQVDKIDELLIGRATESPTLRDFINDERMFFLRNLESVQGDEMDRIILSLTYGRNSEGQFSASYLGPLTKSGGERRLNVAITRSRNGMTVVTSMKTADLDGTGGTASGFKCVREFLSDLESSLQQQNYGVSSDRFAKRADNVSQMVYCESPFEEQVLEFLENQGFQVECQVGSGRFRIDLVVKDGERNIIAIECDGKAYHSSLTARTRDRGRQRILEKCGWRVHRVWSTNWWYFREQEQQALIAAIQAEW